MSVHWTVYTLPLMAAMMSPHILASRLALWLRIWKGPGTKHSRWAFVWAAEISRPQKVRKNSVNQVQGQENQCWKTVHGWENEKERQGAALCFDCARSSIELLVPAVMPCGEVVEPSGGEVYWKR